MFPRLDGRNRHNDGVEGRAWDPVAVNPWVLVADCRWDPAGVFPSALVVGFQSDQGEECPLVRVVANP